MGSAVNGGSDGGRRMLAVGMVVLVGLAAGGASYALFSDSTRATVSIQAAPDFSSPMVIDVRPTAIPIAEANRTNQTGQFVVRVDHGGSTEGWTGFVLRVNGSTIGPIGFDCVAAGEWDCRVRFSRSVLFEAVDSRPGSYVVELVALDGDGTTELGTANIVVREPEPTSTPVEASSGTGADEPSATSGPTDTPTEEPTDTPTDESTPTKTATPAPTDDDS